MFTGQEGPFVHFIIPLCPDEVDAAVVTECPHLGVDDDLALVRPPVPLPPPDHPVGPLNVGGIGASAQNQACHNSLDKSDSQGNFLKLTNSRIWKVMGSSN